MIAIEKKLNMMIPKHLQDQYRFIAKKALPIDEFNGFGDIVLFFLERNKHGEIITSLFSFGESKVLSGGTGIQNMIRSCNRKLERLNEFFPDILKTD